MINFLVYLLTIVGIYGLLSLSLSFQYGQTGLVNFGQVAFFMIGAYLSSIATAILGWPVWVGFILAILGGGVLGALMALPIGDLRQDYWAIATLAAAELIRIIFLNTNLGSDYVGASYGITNIPAPFRSHFTTTHYGYFYLALVAACVVVAYLLITWLDHSPFGRVLKGIRESDDVARALGKDVRSARIWSLVIGGALAGAGGSLYAHFVGFIDPRFFMPLETFLVWAMVIMGGPGNNIGALVGTLVVELIYNSTRFIQVPVEYSATVAALRMVLIGVLIIVVILYLPRGLVPERKRRYRSPDGLPDRRHSGGRHVA
ncbi:MAG: branched-chain amino acid ABC transporter permease [Candidimonas sp.]|nr:MAG: branched-chain amino acid ABC transporter permease [Candidimonas sp.]TAM21304.1 MAG: branched-chain amino acid ABC transporter permease [Candidimonas sp.]TAM73771.1 MAG: branched-chain amino acid ABC transporter permease [Candidimonas sp.]